MPGGKSRGKVRVTRNKNSKVERRHSTRRENALDRRQWLGIFTLSPDAHVIENKGNKTFFVVKFLLKEVEV